jgi:hypothetical protein
MKGLATFHTIELRIKSTFYIEEIFKTFSQLNIEYLAI